MAKPTSETTFPPVDQLSCDAVDVKPIRYSFTSDTWSDDGADDDGPPRWDYILPDPSDWDYAQLAAYFDDHDWPSDQPQFADWSREQLAEALADVGIEVYEHESDETLRAAVIANFDDETIDGLDRLREAARDAIDENRHEYEPLMSYYYPLPHYRGSAGDDQQRVRAATSCVLVDVAGETVLALAGGGMDLSGDICQAYMLLGYLPPFHFTRLPSFDHGSPALMRWILAGCRRSVDCITRWAEHREESLTHELRRISTVHGPAAPLPAPIPVRCVVGPVGQLPRYYYPTAAEFLDGCRKALRTEAEAGAAVVHVKTHEARHVVALQTLHRLGEIALTLQHVDGGTVYDVDEKGDLIQPWPDEFFETEFRLRFDY